MKMTLTVDYDEWQAEKRKLQEAALEEGRVAGYQNALRFLQELTANPEVKYQFGPHFPPDLKDLIIDLAKALRDVRREKWD